MYNSFLIAYRQRKKNLSYCLSSIRLASKICDFNDFDINIINLDTYDSLKGFLSKYEDLNINYRLIYDNKKYFSKSMALNNAFEMSESKFITVLDADCVVSPYFFNGLQEFYKKHDDKSKLCYRVYMLNENITQLIKKEFSKDIFDYKIIKECDTYDKANELYTKKMIDNPNNNELKDKCLGCGIFTINSKLFSEIGGFDEKFEGHGYEDTDFNYRLFLHMNCKNSHLLTNKKYNIFHLFHKKSFTKEYLSRQQYNKNIFLNNKINNIIKVNIK